MTDPPLRPPPPVSESKHLFPFVHIGGCVSASISYPFFPPYIGLILFLLLDRNVVSCVDAILRRWGDGTERDAVYDAFSYREVWGGNSSGVSSPPPPSHKGAAYDDIQTSRRKLPAYARQEEILEAINNNQVVVISGETGCGKTTQVSRQRPPRLIGWCFEAREVVKPTEKNTGGGQVLFCWSF